MQYCLTHPPGREHYWERDLERQVSYPKAKQKGHQESDPITPQELANKTEDQRAALHANSFWADQMESALYHPGELYTPVNFKVVKGQEKMAIPYRVAAPIAWEYSYAFGQAKESLQDCLVMANLHGM